MDLSLLIVESFVVDETPPDAVRRPVKLPVPVKVAFDQLIGPVEVTPVPLNTPAADME